MEFVDLQNKSAAELVEMLAEQRASLRSAKFKARGKQLKQFHTIANFKKTIARILTTQRQREAKKV